MPRFFSYGTLQQEPTQRAIIGRALDGNADALVGFVRATVPIDDAEFTAATGMTEHVDVVHTGDPTDLVPGTTFEISDAELARLDAYEARFDYVRVTTTLASGRVAWVYAHTPDALGA